MRVAKHERQSSAGLARTLMVWVTVLPASIFGLILCRVVLQVQPPRWLGLANLGCLLALQAVTRIVNALRPLQGYLVALIALAVGYTIGGVIESTSLWTAWVAHAPTHQFIVADSVIELIPCLLLALTLIRSGLSRRDVFLAWGEMGAPSPMPFRLPPISWSWLGPLLALFLAGGLAAQLIATVRPDFRMVERAVVGLPVVLAFAAFNAAQEEFRFRAVLLARLIPIVGARQALLVTSLIFGLGHWFGHPSGPSGVLMAGFAGYVWGKSMVETRGFAWAWLIHGFQDIVIFAFLLMAAQ